MIFRKSLFARVHTVMCEGTDRDQIHQHVSTEEERFVAQETPYYNRDEQHSGSHDEDSDAVSVFHFLSIRF
jgi:hypothetical protein